MILLLGLLAAAGAQQDRPGAVDDAVSMFSFSWTAERAKPHKVWKGCNNCCMDGDKVVPCLDVKACAEKGPLLGKYAFVYTHWSPLRNTRFLANIESFMEQAFKYGIDILMLMTQKDIDQTPHHVVQAMDRARIKLMPVDWDTPPGMQLFGASGTEGEQHQTCGPRDMIRLHLFGLTKYDAVAYYDSDVELQGDVLPMLRCAATGKILTTTGSVAPINGGFVAARPDSRILKASVLFAQRASFTSQTGWGGSGYAPWGGKFHGAECSQGFMQALFYKGKSNSSKLARQCFDEAGLRVDEVGVAQLDRCIWNYDGTQGCGETPKDFDCKLVRVHHRSGKHSCRKRG